MGCLSFMAQVLARPLLLSIAVALVASCVQGNQVNRPMHGDELMPGADAWEKVMSANVDRRTCFEVSRELIVQVIPEMRQEALVLLELEPSIPLDVQSASRLIGPQKATISELIDALLWQLENKRIRFVREKKGNWTGFDEGRVDELQAMKRNHQDLFPYLVRSVAKNESTGGFGARVCAQDTLLVTHFSLGHFVPPSVRVPLVIFLSRAPKAVYAVTGMAR